MDGAALNKANLSGANLQQALEARLQAYLPPPDWAALQAACEHVRAGRPHLVQRHAHAARGFCLQVTFSAGSAGP